MKKNKLAGYSLFEVIIVLGIIGIIMIPLSRFIINRIEDNRRQQISNATVDEMYRFIDFINNDELELVDSNFKRNPLFQMNHKNAVYGKRVNNYKIEDELTNDDLSLIWNDRINSERKYFIDQSCSESLLELYLKKEFLRCTLNPLISQQPTLSIERVDLVGDINKRTIDRVDFIVLYHPDKKEDNLYLDNFYNNFIQSFKDKHLYLTQADIIIRKADSNAKVNWKIAKKNDKNISFGELVNNTDIFSDNEADYGIRFSFNVKAGKYLKSDGSVHADKLCWNTKNNQYGPCLTAADENKLVLTSGDPDNAKKAPELCWDRQNNTKSVCLALKTQDKDFPITDAQYLDESNFALTTQDNKGNEISGTLIANVVIENPYYEGTKLVKEYRTVPEVSYHSFSGNSADMIVTEDYKGDDEKEKGQIVMRRKLCPVVNDTKLWPRLTVAVSSMSPVVFDENKGGLGIDLTKEFYTREQQIKGVGLAAGVVLQTRNSFSKDGKPIWIISASLGVNDPSKADSSTYVNPKSLSIMAIEWCSSIKGN